MKIYVPHSSNFDFKNNLYRPIRESKLNEVHQFILPQENGKEVITKDLIKSCHLVVAEVSYPSTGQGIELGWADIFSVPIVCLYQKDKKYSSSLNYVTNDFIAYSDSKEMISKLEEFLKKFS